jgi:hypothetical protein
MVTPPPLVTVHVVTVVLVNVTASPELALARLATVNGASPNFLVRPDALKVIN